MSDNSNTEKDLSEIQNTPDVAAVPDKALNQPYDIPLDELLYGEVKTFTNEEIKKVKQIGYGALGIVVLVAALSIYACQPKKGSMAYGICSTFLELNTPYPHTLNHTALEGSRTAVRIYFTEVDPFGEFKQEMIECKFGPDKDMGMKLTEILRNRRPVDAAIVKKFNTTLPTIMANEPYVIMPPDWKNQLIVE